MIKKFRDITMIEIDDQHMLTVACDSCGGIGNKAHDLVQVSPYITGYYTACVALAETIALGSWPITVVNTLSVEMNDTGKTILDGIGDALDEIGIDRETMLTGSTEENIPVTVTGMGITVIGKLNSSFTYPRAKPGNIAVVVGLPKVGDDVVNDQGEIMNLPTMVKLRKTDFIQDILPVGSKGIGYEALEMARTGGLTFCPKEQLAMDMEQSAGPATCAVVALDGQYLDTLIEQVDLPVHVIGQFIKQNTM
ncbi:selenophosphate synthase [Vallitalea pronyensis]|uniref:Selenophosphate synthase n=1 Tax=Vallitalea pronyensis TaxID=1348613 RepID=A0A8J8SJ49_9FIRM|nr:AIR synthase related protein [Vallitalea pronyensis]QUI25122.1 selenophosphate synthase [Vallitalea pronyensis]